MRHKVNVIIAITLLSSYSCNSQTIPSSSTAPRPQWTLKENALSETTNATLAPGIEVQRANKFRDVMRKDIDKSSPSTIGVSSSILRVSAEPLPIAKSDLICIAIPREVHPHWARDKSAVYTELQLTIGEIFFQKRLVPNEKSIAILYKGGFLRTDHGTTVGDEVASGSYPIEIGKPYLLFLDFNQSTDSFSVLRAWDVSTARPTLLNENGRPSELSSPIKVDNLTDLKDLIQTRINLLESSKTGASK